MFLSCASGLPRYAAARTSSEGGGGGAGRSLGRQGLRRRDSPPKFLFADYKSKSAQQDLSSRQRAVVSQFYLSVLELAKSHRESRWAALTSLAQAVAFEHKALVSVFRCFELLGVMTIDSN